MTFWEPKKATELIRALCLIITVLMISFVRCSYGCTYFLCKGSPNLLFLPTQLVVHLARWRRLCAPHAVLSSFEHLASMFSWQIWSCSSFQFWSLLKTKVPLVLLIEGNQRLPPQQVFLKSFCWGFSHSLCHGNLSSAYAEGRGDQIRTLPLALH